MSAPKAGFEFRIPSSVRGLIRSPAVLPASVLTQVHGFESKTSGEEIMAHTQLPTRAAAIAIVAACLVFAGGSVTALEPDGPYLAFQKGKV